MVFMIKLKRDDGTHPHRTAYRINYAYIRVLRYKLVNLNNFQVVCLLKGLKYTIKHFLNEGISGKRFSLVWSFQVL